MKKTPKIKAVIYILLTGVILILLRNIVYISHKISKFIENNLLFKNIIIYKNMNDALIILLATTMVSLILYLLYVFYDKSVEYNNLKSFVNTRTDKLEGLFANINKNNINFVKEDSEICRKLKNSGSS